MTVTIAEELLLLALSEHQGRFLISTAQLDLALGGGVLAELALAGSPRSAGGWRSPRPSRSATRSWTPRYR